MEPFIGQIMAFGGHFAPRGWAQCDGQLLPISQYSALFSILGTTYGGDGVTTFALPDLRGRAPVHMGHGPGLTQRNLGQKFGEEKVTLTTSQMPAHSHTVTCSTSRGTSGNPAGNVLGGDPDLPYEPSGGQIMSTSMIHDTGGNAPHDNSQPSLALTYVIALQGIYPSRN